MNLIKPAALPTTPGSLTRASTASFFDSTGLLRIAQANIPRYNFDPNDLSIPPVLLAEAAATNRNLWSEDISNASYVKAEIGGFISDAATAPDGTSTMDKVYERASGAGVVQGHRLYQRVTVINPQTVETYSRVFKAAERSYINLWVRSVTNPANGFNATFYLSGDGSVVQQADLGDAVISDAGIKNIGGGRYRVYIKGQASAADAGTQVDLYTRIAKGPSGDYSWANLISSVTRNTTAVAFGAAGDMVEFAASTPRITTAGLSIDAATTNYVRNPRWEGTVPGTPGTIPTDSAIAAVGGLSSQVVGLFTTNGKPVLRLRLWTPTVTSSTTKSVFYPEGTASILLVGAGVSVTGGMEVALNTGSTANCQLGIRIDVAGDTQYEANFVPDGTLREYSSSCTTAGAATGARVGIILTPSGVGVAIDVTVDLALPRIDKLSYLPAAALPPVGSPGTVTRNADQMLGTSPLPVAGVIKFHLTRIWPLGATTDQHVVAWIGATGSDTIFIYRDSGNGHLTLAMTTGGVSNAALAITTTVLPVGDHTLAFFFDKTNNVIRVSLDGGAVVTKAVTVGWPTTISRYMGMRTNKASQLLGSLTQFVEYTGARVDADLISLSGGADPTAVDTSFRADPTDDLNYTGDGASGVYTWGGQFEDGALSSYIKTTTAAVTRSADVVPTFLTNIIETPPAAYAGGTTYNYGDTVSVLNGHGYDVYGSRIDSNTGNAPASSPTQWRYLTTTYPAWTTGTWGLNDMVIYNGDVFQSLQAANTNHIPTDVGSVWWVQTGVANRENLADGVVGTQATYSDFISVDFTVGAGDLLDTFALLNVMARQVRVVMTDAVEGMVFDETFDMVETSGITDWYAYFFAPIVRAQDILYIGLPLYAGARISISLSDIGSTVGVGEMILGLSDYIGDSQFGAALSITDYSVKSTDTFGNTTVVERVFSKQLDVTVFTGLDLDAEDVPREVDRVFNLLAKYRATPILFWAADEYTSTAIYGFYKTFSLVISYFNYSVLTATIEGLT